MIKAVIFDMDGLLIDSEPLWEIVEKKVTTELNVEYIQGETMGMRVDEVVDFWYRKSPWNNFKKDEIVNRLIKGVTDLIYEKGMLMPGVMELIGFFDKSGIPMAIASSSYISIINAVIGKFELASYIKEVHSAEYEEFGKPNPAVYITTANKLGVRCEECLAFEDSPNGVLAAKSAKMKCIAVPTEVVKDDKSFLLADFTLSSLEEFDDKLFKLLNK